MKDIIKNCPSFEDDGDLHYVIYVEYIDKIPHSVNTVVYIPNATGGPYWRLHWWNFECADNDENDLIAYNSGSGGCEKDINAPNFVKSKSIKEVWLAKGINFRSEGKNFNLIEDLIELKNEFTQSKNPFDIAEILPVIEYCPKCKCYSREFCDEHLYFDDNGDVRYRGNHKYVNY